jgi:hypothetical protein
MTAVGAPADTVVLSGLARALVQHQLLRPEQAAALLQVGASPVGPGEWSPVERAVWTMVASQFLNLDEFLNK